MKVRASAFLAIILWIGMGIFRANAGSGRVDCVNGMADVYPCRNVDLLSQLTLAEIGATDATILGNDHWGWHDPVSGKDFVIFGLTDSTSFIDITDRENPIYLGNLAGRDGASTWRDIKVYQDHAFITSDMPTESGLQIFDLTQLRNVINPPAIFTETAHYDGFGPGHNLWINEDSGTLFVFRSDSCNAGIHMVDISAPTAPVFAGCFAESDTPLSDAECLNYNGPDPDYQGKEICFIGSDDNLSIGDVTNKSAPTIIAQFGYAGIARAHQGVLTPDGKYWLVSDTMDEMMHGYNTRTYIIDVADLDNPISLGHHAHATAARDHNVYIADNLAYQTNWMAGLRVLDYSALPSPNLIELGYFDIEPGSDSISTSGAWSSYPWWGDGVVTVSGVENGLFVLQFSEQPTGVGVSDFAGAAQNNYLVLLFLLVLGGTIGAHIRKRQLAPKAQQLSM